MKVHGLFRNAQSTLNVPAGGVIFQEGEIGANMFGIVEGQVQLQTTSKVIATLDVDDVFGEMALVDSSPRMATAVATVECRPSAPTTRSARISMGPSCVCARTPTMRPASSTRSVTSLSIPR